jgi:hypothetical protein
MNQIGISISFIPKHLLFRIGKYATARRIDLISRLMMTTVRYAPPWQHQTTNQGMRKQREMGVFNLQTEV